MDCTCSQDIESQFRGRRSRCAVRRTLIAQCRNSGDLLLPRSIASFVIASEDQPDAIVLQTRRCAVVGFFSNGVAYYSPDDRNIGGGGNTVYAYSGSVPIVELVKVGGGMLTEFQGGGVYLSPNGQNLGGGGASISVANWIHAAAGPFPLRDSGKGAVFAGRLFLSGGFGPQTNLPCSRE
jgi:hypothetical protein